ncbi:MAG: hypothetical protein JWN51_1294 [Phycisphaerales bacterium]|nr:hypothetical protein [Phycisphaerales bacterium]
MEHQPAPAKTCLGKGLTPSLASKRQISHYAKTGHLGHFSFIRPLPAPLFILHTALFTSLTVPPFSARYDLYADPIP